MTTDRDLQISQKDLGIEPALPGRDLDPQSLAFWIQLKDDLTVLRSGIATPQNFLVNYDPKMNPGARDWGRPGRYFGVYYAQRITGIDPTQFLTASFTPPEDPQFQEVVQETRVLMELKFRKPPKFRGETIAGLKETEFWDEFGQDLSTYKPDLDL